MNFEFYSIIWCGEKICNEKFNEQIRSICNYLIEFQDEKQCFDYLQNQQSQWQRSILIVTNLSDTIAQIFDLKSIVAIYLFSTIEIVNNHRKVSQQRFVSSMIHRLFFRSKVYSIESMN